MTSRPLNAGYIDVAGLCGFTANAPAETSTPETEGPGALVACLGSILFTAALLLAAAALWSATS